MKNQRAFPQKQITRNQAHSQLVRLLANCPDRKLEALTVATIMRLHRVDAKTAEYELGRERAMRQRTGFEI